MECLRTAFNAGADAVYLGGDRFNARAYASNFSGKELIEALDIAHFYGRRVYLTLNTLFKDEELKEIYDYIYPLYTAGLDGVILQDLGAAKLISECFPSLPLHASTQMSITDVPGVRLLQKLSFKRVVPARELSLSELKRIIAETGIEVECFIHGALCYSYSGRCLFSSLLGGRSGNRGRCAGPCRLPYNGRYYLSAKDICAIDILDKLVDSGICSFKIEGRMKSKEYVAGVTGIYRKYLDLVLSGEKGRGYRVSENDRNNLISLYTRSGNSAGYYFNRNGSDMLSLDSPSYESAEDEKKRSLFLKYAGKAPEKGVEADCLIKEGEECALILSCLHKGQRVSVSVAGDKAGKAEKHAADSGSVERQIGKLGGTGFFMERFNARIEGSPFLSAASLNSLRREGAERLREKILRMHGRVASYRPEKAEELLSVYDEKVDINNATEINIPRDFNGNSLNGVYIKTEDTGTSDKDHGPALHIRLLDLKALDAVLSINGADVITLPVSAFRDREELIRTCERVRESGKRFFPALPYAQRSSGPINLEGLCADGGLKSDMDEGASDVQGSSAAPLFIGSSGKSPIDWETLKEYSDGAVADNLEELSCLSDINYDKLIIADIHLYDMNRLSSEIIRSFGKKIVTCVPVELNKRELYRRGITGEELIVYGRLPLMLSAQCVKKTMDLCDGVSSSLLLKDRYGNDFPCVSFCRECTNVIFNSVPNCITEKDGIIEGLKPRLLRLDFTVEPEEEIVDIIKYYVNGAEDSKGPVKKYTKGHLNRGVE